MNRRRAAIALVRSAGLLALALRAQDAAAVPPSAELARCATIAAASERLACYDALECATMSDADKRLACYDALAKAKSSPSKPAAAAAAVVAGAQTAGDDVSSFGLTQHATLAAAQDPQKIRAKVASLSADRHGNVTVVLDNGQTWAVREPDPRVQAGDTVTIRHGALGSFLMTTPARHSYRVQRLQ